MGTFHHERYPDNLLLRMGYSFAAGDLITLVLNQNGEIMWNWGVGKDAGLPNQENILEYITCANSVRNGIGKKYLIDGKMCKPLDIECEDKNILELEHGYVCGFPKVFTSCWKATDGCIGQVVTNYNNEPVSIKIDTEKELRILTDDGKTHIYKNGDTYTLNNLETVLIEIDKKADF